MITSDVGATSLGFAATFCFWLYLRNPTWKRVGLAGFMLGVAQLSKFSMLPLYAIWPLIWLCFEVSRGQTPNFRRRLATAFAQGVAIVLMSIVTINFGYGFEGSGRPLGSYRFASEMLTRRGSTPGHSENH